LFTGIIAFNNMEERQPCGGDDPKANLPAISLLICSRNRPQLLWETIQSILAGCAIPSEIIIIDQSDGPNPVLSIFHPEKDCMFRYIWSERKGVSLGRNMAIANASHPLLVLTDDDMLMTPIWFDAIVRALVRAGERSIITGQVLAAANENEEGFAPSIKAEKHSNIYQGRVGKDILYTGNMAIHRSTLQHIGMFDERLGPGTPYPAAEDNDLGFRLLEANYRIIYEPDALLYHRAWRSKQETLQLSWNYGRGQGAFYAKYFSLRDIHMMRRMLKDVLKYFLHLPAHIVFDRMQAQQGLCFIAGLVSGALHWTINGLRGNL